MPDYVNKVTPEWESEIAGRNPQLQGQHLDIYQFIVDNPGCCRSEVTRGCGMRGTSATARVKELVDRGLVLSSQNRTKIDARTGKTVQTLWPLEDAKHRKPKDKVLVYVTLYVDSSGVYSAKARVVGELPSNSSRIPVMRKDVLLQAPYPADYKHHFIKNDDGALTQVSVEDTLANTSLIIEGN